MESVSFTYYAIYCSNLLWPHSKPAIVAFSLVTYSCPCAHSLLPTETLCELNQSSDF